MSKNLVIVESPAKAKTISKFLGKDYIVKASMGHVRDLPKSTMGIDIENDFEPKYIIPVDKKKTISELKSCLKSDTTLWIATDEDREGEAIGWHLLSALKVDNSRKTHRIVFHEITKSALEEAIKNPRDIDENLVSAQQARRVLDRLVGYELSPLLWKKVRYGLSAGRVQSVAVRLIVEREREIRAFKKEEYWSIEGLFKKEQEFSAKLHFIDGKKAEIKDEKSADKILKDLDGASYEVSKVEKKQIKRNPAPPFITSTLQQEAARKLKMSVKKAMMIAQQLYEGIDIGSEGALGLITYMRTDSVTLSKQALDQARHVISDVFGKDFVLETPRYYKNRKGAQEAHEAIRPTDLSRKPEALIKYLDKDQLRLYELIWKRTMACQMKEAILNKVSVDIEPKIAINNKLPTTDYIFRASGQTIEFPGFMRAYVEGYDDPEEALEDKEKILPDLNEKDSVDLKKLIPNQHFTEPPPRYTEASLVKKLEAEGIGRPSTYAPTISTIMTRGYVEKEAGALKPTDTGEVVNDVLVEHFADIVDYKFTAKMEDTLDDIAEGKEKWKPVIKNFYKPFHQNIVEKESSIQKSDLIKDETKEICEKCGKPMEIKLGRYGKFLSCTGYPDCKNAKPLNGKEKDESSKELEKKLSDKKCNKCGEPMLIKNGKYGEFLACSAYPKCKNIQSIFKLTGTHCPDCKDGQLVERRVRKTGKIFWGCNKFPKCKFASWDEPQKEKCPKCGALTVKKVSKKEGEKIKCSKCEWVG